MRRFPRAPKSSTLVRLALVTAFVTFRHLAATRRSVVGPNVNMGGGPAIHPPFDDHRRPVPAAAERAVARRLVAQSLPPAGRRERLSRGRSRGSGRRSRRRVARRLQVVRLRRHLDVDASARPQARPVGRGPGVADQGLAAAADPTVRAGTSGLFYYSGIAFNRGDRPARQGVRRALHRQQQQGRRRPDSVPRRRRRSITGTSGQFLDKPWIVADIARDRARA